ncbi:MAG TPA: fatty acid desaturase [Bacteroidia bacterium]
MTDISEITITDPTYKEKVSYNFIERFIFTLLNDKRDLAFVRLCAVILFTTVPFAIFMFIPGCFRWWLVPIYYAFNLAFLMGPFILMLHLTSHRPVFKKEYKFLNNIIPWLIGPFMGETPESYFAHHLGMHHAEGNMPEDHSSTMKYQRDSFIDFMKYYFTFLVFGSAQLATYLKQKNRTKIRKNFLTGELLFWLFCIALMFFNWKVTLVVFVFPVIVVRFFMMAGNWGQHAFIDAAKPDNSYTNSINCINSRYNQTCFNDGYHIVHHLKPAMHWMDLPTEFLNNINAYGKENAIIFKKLDFFSVWFFLMLKRYDILSKNLVTINHHIPTQEQAIALLKQRTKKIEPRG